MAWMTRLLMIVLATAVSLLLLSKLPLGVEINHWKKVLNLAVGFGVLNALLELLLRAVFPPDPALLFWVALFFHTLVNGILFAIAALLMQGFRLRHGIWSTVSGAIVLGLVNAWLCRILPGVNL
jgi:putative membrane protein